MILPLARFNDGYPSRVCVSSNRERLQSRLQHDTPLDGDAGRGNIFFPIPPATADNNPYTHGQFFGFLNLPFRKSPGFYVLYENLFGFGKPIQEWIQPFLIPDFINKKNSQPFSIDIFIEIQ